MGNLFGSKSNTSSTAPPPQVVQAFTNLINRGTSVANQPLQQYGGPMVAGFTPDQTASFQNIENSQGLALPFYNSAANLTASGAGPASAGIAGYMNPYQNSVVQSTLDQINHQNAIDQNSLKGNAISSGAFGGDRGYLAQAELANDQEKNTNSTISNLLSSGWNTALGASQNDLSRQLAAGSQMGQLGTGAQTSALQGATALNNAGAQQQTLAQQQLNVPYEQFQQQQYPFETTQFLASLMGGAAPNLGSTTSTPGPSGISQVAGLAATILPYVTRAKKGGRIDSYDNGGQIIDTTPFNVHNDPTAGGGLGDWINPLPQYHPSNSPIVTQLSDGVLHPPKVISDAKRTGTNGINSVFDGIASLAPLAMMFLKDGGKVGGYDNGGIVAPTIDRSKFAVHNAPSEMGGLGQWFNPLPQGQYGGNSPIVTPLSDSVLNPPDTIGKIGHKGSGLDFNSYAGLGALFGAAPLFGLPFRSGGRVGQFADGGDVSDDGPDDLGLSDDDLDDLAQGIGAAVPTLSSVVPQVLATQAQSAPQQSAPAPQAPAGATVDQSALPALLAAQAQAKGGPDATAAAPDTSSNPFGLSDKGYAIMNAGLGMLASNSPFPLQAIGQGAMQGLGAYQQMKQAEAQKQYKTMMAEAAMTRAQDAHDNYMDIAKHRGDQHKLVDDGKTMWSVFIPGDGSPPEKIDLTIPSSKWQAASNETKRLAIEAANAAEEKRHHLAIEPGGKGNISFDNPGVN